MEGLEDTNSYASTAGSESKASAVTESKAAMTTMTESKATMTNMTTMTESKATMTTMTESNSTMTSVTGSTSTRRGSFIHNRGFLLLRSLRDRGGKSAHGEHSEKRGNGGDEVHIDQDVLVIVLELGI